MKKSVLPNHAFSALAISLMTAGGAAHAQGFGDILGYIMSKSPEAEQPAKPPSARQNGWQDTHSGAVLDMDVFAGGTYKSPRLSSEKPRNSEEVQAAIDLILSIEKDPRDPRRNRDDGSLEKALSVIMNDVKAREDGSGGADIPEGLLQELNQARVIIRDGTSALGGDVSAESESGWVLTGTVDDLVRLYLAK